MLFRSLELNEAAAKRLRCEHQIAIVPGATHLFEEPGTLEEVATHAAQWFGTHLPPSEQPLIEGNG